MKKYSICAFAFLLTLPLIAQQKKQRKVISLDNIEVVANRTEELQKDVPQKTFVIEAPEIGFSNTRSMAELLSEHGRLAVQKSQMGGGSPILRGFEASRILLDIDNVRLNSLIFRAGHLQNVISIQPSDIEQLTVLYGPSSVAYGSDALGGVIHVKTKDPKLGFSNRNLNVLGHVSQRFGTACDEKTSHFDLNIGGKQWASYTSMTYSDFGDLTSGKRKNPFMPSGDNYIYRKYTVEHVNGMDQVTTNLKKNKQLNSGYNQFDLMQKILFQPNDRFRHVLNVQYSACSPVPRYDRLTDMKGTAPKYAEWYYGDQERLLASYNLKMKKLLGADRLSLITSYQHLKESRMKRKLNKTNLDRNIENVDIVSLSFDWQKRIDRNFFHWGVDGNLQFLASEANSIDIDNENTHAIGTRYPGGDNYMHNIDAFVMHRYTFAPDWNLSEGVRFGYSNLYADFVDPTYYPFELGGVTQENMTYSASVGLNYAPKGWKFALQASTGYRVPNIDDMGKVFDSSASDKIVVIPNTDIDPEKTISVDLNVTRFIHRNLKWENVVFFTHLFDAIALAPTTLNGQSTTMYDGEECKVVSNQNYNKGYIFGFSSALNWDLNALFSVDAAVTYTRGRLVDDGHDKPMSHIAPLFGRLGVEFHTKDQRLRASAFALFNGEKSIDDYDLNGEDNLTYATELGRDGLGEGLPAWYTLNFKLGYSVTHNLKVDAGVENLLDTEYRTFASGINAAGRNFYTKAIFSF